MVQVPPRGVWGRSGRALQAPLESWLGRSPTGAPVADLVRRYLGAFGPATVRDAQTWSGLTKLAEVFDELRGELRDCGDGLWDLPDAPRPAPDTPAPVRFLYDYDNLLLSHADRSRVLGEPGVADYALHGFTGDSNLQPSSVLVDGFVAATWRVERARRSVTLTVRGFRRLTKPERTAVTAEGAALLEFLHPGGDHEVVIA